jgi:putative ABC transport system permease protein
LRSGIERWTQRLESFALATGADSSAGVLLMGVDPVREARVTRLPGRVTEGRFFSAQDDYACVLGAATARNLGVRLGDPVVLMAYDRYGALAAEEFTLVGIITSGEIGIDRGMVIVPLAAAQEFLEMPGRVTSVPARVDDKRLERVTRELKGSLDEQTYDVLRWHDMFPVMKEWVALSDGFHYVFLGIVLLIVVAGVLNTVLLSMLERTHEFGVLMALGMRGDQVGALISLESLFMGVFGILAGTCLGLGLVWLTAHVGIDLSVLVGPTERFYVDPVVRPRLSADHVLYTIATVFTASLVAGFYPARRAARLEAVEAIRHV